MDEEQPRAEPQRPSDPGLKQLLTYTLIALVLAVLLALVAVNVVIRLFDTG